MDMPTTCTECFEVVEFDDMVDIADTGASIFVCIDCAYEMNEDD